MNSVAGREFPLLVRSVEHSPRNAAEPESLPRCQFCPSLGSWLTTAWKPWPFWGMRERAQVRHPRLDLLFWSLSLPNLNSPKAIAARFRLKI